VPRLLRVCRHAVSAFTSVALPVGRTNVLRAVLAVLLWRRGLHKKFPAFFIYLIYRAMEQFTLWTMDVLPEPWVSAPAWWRVFFVGVVIEDFTKLAVI
jgi:hypothetical protein